jgi:hypothetical protein
MPLAKGEGEKPWLERSNQPLIGIKPGFSYYSVVRRGFSAPFGRRMPPPQPILCGYLCALKILFPLKVNYSIIAA